MIHTTENNSDTQRHLFENRQKFKSDAEYLLNLLKDGKELSNMNVAMMGIESRRLRDLYASIENVKRKWVEQDGKRKYVVYYYEKTN